MIVLASTSPQRRAILEQLEIPFRVVAPDYEETGDDPVEHAAGKARSVDGGGDPVLGVDTVVVMRRSSCSGSPRPSARRARCLPYSRGGRTRSSRGSACAAAIAGGGRARGDGGDLPPPRRR